MMRNGLWLGCALALSACGASLLGGECAPGYLSQADGTCALPLDDDAHGDAMSATDAAPTAPGDGSTNVEAAVGTDGTDVAVASDGSNLLRAGVRVPTSAHCATGERVCDSVCVDVRGDATNCGGCGITCGTGNVCSAGHCGVTCTAPLVACDGVCIDTQSDPSNCGACAHACTSGVCNAGICRDARAGHIVVIGHDYTQSRPDQDRILANAVFLGAGASVRVLAYAQYSDTSAGGEMAQVGAAITRAADGRAWSRVLVTDATRVPSELSIDSFDVFLVYSQPGADGAAIDAAASVMGSALTGFARSGGVIVVLDGATDGSATFPLANATGLLTITDATSANDLTVDVSAPVDAIAAGVSAAYRAESNSVAFATGGGNTVFAASDRPVVLHFAVLDE